MYRKHYKPKKYIISKLELALYRDLFELSKKLDLVLFAQVPVYSLVSVIGDHSYKNPYFNKIKSKTVDFTFVNKNNCKTILCIELDDSTHNLSERKSRDEFINGLFLSMNIPLLRIPVSNNYNIDQIENILQIILNKEIQKKLVGIIFSH